jgi:hypothetical protein
VLSGPLLADGWLGIAGSWFAMAADAEGHHDGAREYVVKLWPSEFGSKYYVGGEVRFTHFHGASRNMIFRLPTHAPSQLDRLRLAVPVCPEGATGRMMLVGGLQVRPRSNLTIHMPAWRCCFE